MSRRTIGILASVVGSALGAWWWTTQRRASGAQRVAARDRGRVIFDNHTAAEPVEGVV